MEWIWENGPDLTEQDSWDRLLSESGGCRKCALEKGRNHLVFGVGSRNAPVMLIGEGPGEQEDLQGEPFVGPAGKLLDTMLEIIDLDRTKVYITNIVKCRPPHNRDPLPEEEQACLPWLRRQIALVDPKVLVLLGRIAATSLIDPDFKVTRDHGKWFEVEGRRAIVLYHPSALLRTPSWRPDAFVDLKTLQREIQNFYV